MPWAYHYLPINDAEYIYILDLLQFALIQNSVQVALSVEESALTDVPSHQLLLA